jgi:hypothetical protein
MPTPTPKPSRDTTSEAIGPFFLIAPSDKPIAPLTRLALTGPTAAEAVVSDGAGREYARLRVAPGAASDFLIGGGLGTHTVRLLDAGGTEVHRLNFRVDAETAVDDNTGRFRELFDILNRTMRIYSETGSSPLVWNGTTYHSFVPWILDHLHTAKGMQYFSPHTGSFVEALAKAQREDGMIWSNAFSTHPPGQEFFLSAYGPYDYSRRMGDVQFNRQPAENHCEANFVEAMYLHWKATGDDDWLKRHVDHAMRALDYVRNSDARWSSKYGLLKRGYCIDSWDFQVEDEYTVEFPLATGMLIDPERTKFGVFYGDNTGYANAAEELAEMLDHLGRTDEATRFRERAQGIRQRVDEVSWNGDFFTHHVEEDESVVRDLGVDESEQFSFSNAYSLNRGISHEQATRIIEKYHAIHENLREGSVGEWYAIIPPFERGFGGHNGRWQYMNGGVHGHAAGELARGAFAHGFERYGVDILDRIRELAKQSGGIVKFAYRGGFERPDRPQDFTTLDLAPCANMDLRSDGDEPAGVPGWMDGERGNDMRLPVGRQTLAGVPFEIADPKANGRRAVIAVGRGERTADRIEIPIDATAGAVYLLHTVSSVGESKVAAGLTFCYDDGSSKAIYLVEGKHLAGWWYPALNSPCAGVAWRGPNDKSTDVGVCWAAIANPQPDKTIRSLAFTASEEGATYALIGLTRADRMPWSEPPVESYGGPDNWAGGLCVAALVEGLAGVNNSPGGAAFERVTLAPRWSAADGVTTADVVIRFVAGEGYLAYQYRHDPQARALHLTVTGSGEHCAMRLLLPQEATGVTEAQVDDQVATFETERLEGSTYLSLSFPLPGPRRIDVRYAAHPE